MSNTFHTVGSFPPSSTHRHHHLHGGGPSHPDPSPSPPSNSYQGRASKAEQIAQNFYTKTVQIVVGARVIPHDLYWFNRETMGLPPSIQLLQSPGQPSSKKTNKWFNIELEELDFFKEDLKFWRNLAASPSATGASSPPPLIIEIFLDASDLSQTQILIILDEHMRRHRIDLGGLGLGIRKSAILLERWTLSLDSSSASASNTTTSSMDLPVIYKYSIIFFRSLYTYARLLPAFQLYRQLQKARVGSALKIGCRLVSGSSTPPHEYGIDVPLLEDTKPVVKELRIGQIETPLGIFSLRVEYRTNVSFHVDDPEALLSARFIDMDENYFSPPMSRNLSSQGRKEKDLRLVTKLPLERRHEYSSSSPQTPNSLPSTSSLSPHPVYGPLPPARRSDSHGQSQFAEGIAMQRRSSTQSTASSQSLRRRTTLSSSPWRTELSYLSGRESSASGRRPSVTFVSPFKSPSLSSSPSSLPFYNRSPSSSIAHHPSPDATGMSSHDPATSGGISAGRPIPELHPSSSLKSVSSISSSNLPRLSPSSYYRYERNRKFSRGSTANRSDEGASDTASVRSHRDSFGASSISTWQAEEEDVGEFLKMIDSRESLGIFSRRSTHVSASPPSHVDQGGQSGTFISGSMHRSRLALSRFQQLRDVNNALIESISSSAVLQQQPGLTEASSSQDTTHSNPPLIASPDSPSLGQPTHPMISPSDSSSQTRRFSQPGRPLPTGTDPYQPYPHHHLLNHRNRRSSSVASRESSSSGSYATAQNRPPSLDISAGGYANADEYYQQRRFSHTSSPPPLTPAPRDGPGAVLRRPSLHQRETSRALTYSPIPASAAIQPPHMRRPSSGSAASGSAGSSSVTSSYPRIAAVQETSTGGRDLRRGSNESEEMAGVGRNNGVCDVEGEGEKEARSSLARAKTTGGDSLSTPVDDDDSLLFAMSELHVETQSPDWLVAHSEPHGGAAAGLSPSRGTSTPPASSNNRSTPSSPPHQMSPPFPPLALRGSPALEIRRRHPSGPPLAGERERRESFSGGEKGAGRDAKFPGSC
ncbi:uncharacterized protein VTP21DRAFT_559 [Calcarisporiella thermophila]|uniref:uncharacterized protein n=1 Tax=Calcarisporiella thermophila TaxID=911321 RepID=UPI0037441376